MMTNGELNQFILHYLTKDKTHSAIMLTGSWGTGKSYYIQNVLVPFLKEDHKKECVTVPPYMWLRRFLFVGQIFVLRKQQESKLLKLVVNMKKNIVLI